MFSFYYLHCNFTRINIDFYSTERDSIITYQKLHPTGGPKWVFKTLRFSTIRMPFLRQRCAFCTKNLLFGLLAREWILDLPLEFLLDSLLTRCWWFPSLFSSTYFPSEHQVIHWTACWTLRWSPSDIWSFTCPKLYHFLVWPQPCCCFRIIYFIEGHHCPLSYLSKKSGHHL